MGLFSGSGGLTNAFQSVAATVANLAGQAVSMLKLTLTQAAGQDAISISNNGARVHFGSGASDFASSDGTTVTFAGPLSTTNMNATQYLGSGSAVVVPSYVQSGDTGIRSNIANGATAIGVKVSNFPNLTTAGAQIIGFYPDNGTTEVFAVDIAGRLLNPSPGNSTGTPGNATLNTASGRCSMNAGAGATLVITNNLVSATTLAFASIMTVDATMTAIKSIVQTANTITITFNAASTGTVTIGWLIYNV